MKNIVALIGSLRKDSLNRAVYKKYKALAEKEFEFVEGNFADFPLYSQDIDTEPRAVIELADQIKASDGLIFFSPEYNYSIPGVLKNAIDWLSRNEQQPFNDKPAAIIGVSPGNIGTARMQYHLRQVGVFLNLHFLNKPEVMIGQGMSKIEDGVLKDQSTIDFLTKHIQAFKAHL